jgi:hypothetical protein
MMPRAQWSEQGAGQSLRLLASDRGSKTRSALPPALYSEIVAPFLRFDAAVPDQLYAIGGRNERQEPLDTVEMFDTWHGRWEECPNMSIKRSGCAAAALPDGRLMVSGGYDERGIVLGLLASSEVFDPVKQEWTPTAAQLQRPRWGHGSAMLGGKVYAVGGCALRNGTPLGDDVMETLRDCEVYDITAQTWSSITSLHVARAGSRLVALDAHRLAVVGGCDDVFGRAEMLASVEVYDTRTGTWMMLQEQLSVPRTTAAAAALDEHRIIVMGGAPSLSSVEIFDVPGTGKGGEAAATQPSSSSRGGYKDLGDMTEGRMGCQAVLMKLPADGKDYPLCTRPCVVVVGGENGEEDWDDEQETARQFDSVLVYDLEGSRWRSEQSFPPIPTPRTAMTLCVAPGQVRGYVS